MFIFYDVYGTVRARARRWRAYFVGREVIAVGYPLVQFADVREVRHQPRGTSLSLLAVEHQVLFHMVVVFVVPMVCGRGRRIFLDLLPVFSVEQRHIT